ncbi:uncharacterized protein LOC124155242 [Ischnura elegans]|uniref:uncharacterized protein LOC124155242 n=1 Tax=Ischnura elegans TaxID=197161 RepID=UPI001ED88326|nr:uncharacterized protein LOC124155242 [Ischnura elegans]
MTVVLEPTSKGGPLEVEALIIENIARCPKMEVQKKQWPHMRNLALADPQYYRPEAIDILLGAEWLGTVMIGNTIAGPKGTPSAIETLWGYCLVGKVHQTVENIDSFCLAVESQLEYCIRKFWEVEEPPTVRYLSEDDRKCESHFQATVRREESGRYIVELPLRNDAPLLGNSRNAALRRFIQLERRLDKNPKHRQYYNAFMADYEPQGHMIRASMTPTIPAPFYIPHHCIYRGEDALGKFRVVFDASMKSESGPSLNEILFTGPKLHLNIVDVLLQFRMHNVVVIADIRQMYRNIGISERHYDFQRVFWRASSDLPIAEYNLTTVTYGVASASYLAIRTLHKLVEDEGAAYPGASHALKRSTYMDDIVISVESTEEAVKLRDEWMKLLSLDSSEKGYAGVVYSRVTLNSGEVAWCELYFTASDIRKVSVALPEKMGKIIRVELKVPRW